MRRDGSSWRPRLESLEERLCLAASVGWDGPGRGAASLGYYIGSAPSSLAQSAANAAIKQALGAWSAAEEGAGFAFNVIGEHRSNPRMLIIHECMGRNCGYLTAETARRYHELLKSRKWAPSLGLTRERWDVHAVFLPEMKLDLAAGVDVEIKL